MMNILSLRFKNDKLETEYQQYRQANQIEQILIYSGSSIIITIPFLVLQLMEQKYILFSMTVLIFTLLIWSYFKIRNRSFQVETVIMMYEVFVLLVPVTAFIVGFCTIMSTSEIVQNSALLFLIATFLPITGNILLAIIQYYSIFSSACVILYQVLGFGMQICILFWYSLFLLVLRYQQIKSNRELFVKSLINDSIYDILRSTIKEDLIVFKYDEHNRKYDLIFEKITIDCQFELMPFLSKFKLQNNVQLSDYIWKLQTTISSPHFEVSLTGYYNLNLYIQNYPKQTFIIKLYQPQDNQLIQQCCKKEHIIINKFIKAALKTLILKIESRIQRQFWHLVLAYQTRLNLLRIQVRPAIRNVEMISFVKIMHSLSRLFQINITLDDEYTINSDQKLLSVLIQQILWMICRNNDKCSVHLQELDEFSIKMSFRFENAISLEIDALQKEQIMNLVGILSLDEPQLEQNQIDIDLIRNLQVPFHAS